MHTHPAYLLGALAAALTAATAVAQTPDSPHPWLFRARLVGSASSDGSEPAGYTIYSGITTDVALRRAFGRFAVEVSGRTESREVDYQPAAGTATRLGSLEMIPVTATLLWNPLHGTVQPYLGAGAAFTWTWEKSGVLDTMDVAATLSPALQLGVDFALGPRAVLNLDVRWNALQADIRARGTPFTKVRIDPTTLGIGVGFRF